MDLLPGRQDRSEDNPVLLANRKAKALSSLLKAQSAVSKVRLPWLDALVFLSADDIQCDLTGPARNRVCSRTAPQTETRPERKGILAALINREVRASIPTSRRHRHQGGQGALPGDGAGGHPPVAAVPAGRRLRARRLDRRWPGVPGPARQARRLRDVFCRVRQYTVAQAASEEDRQRLQAGGGP